MFKILGIFKMKNSEQDICERKLIRIMKNLNVSYFDYNWDRSSCYIEFRYQDILYRMEHSVEKANSKGTQVLRSGLDSLMELVESLEDLCQIIERGTYKLDTWLSGMKKSTLTENTPTLEDAQVINKSLVKQKYKNEEFIIAAPQSSLVDFDRHKVSQRPVSK
ncbi:hypothetical protein [Alkalihalobacillus deserti]|uniref:hypothetical protein n=1 Tax=Alkalihalobacillus deserti TaxID=2879466 RepID=UPI001D150AD6|nr:hypothetical protein [Alkalihalobacillus deserti]